MGDRALIFVPSGDGFLMTSVHNHGGPFEAGVILARHYPTLEKARSLVALGNLSVLGSKLDEAVAVAAGELDAMVTTVAYRFDAARGRWLMRRSASDKVWRVIGPVEVDVLDVKTAEALVSAYNTELANGLHPDVVEVLMLLCGRGRVDRVRGLREALDAVAVIGVPT